MSTTFEPDAQWECNENKFQFNWTATKVQVCKDLTNGGLKVVFSVQWETYCRRINVSDYTTRWSKQGGNMLVLKDTATRLFNVATAKFDSVKDVWLPILSLRIWRQTFRQALPHECETSLYNREKSKVSASFATWMWNKLVKWGNGRAKHCQCLKNEFLSVHTAALTHAKKFGFVTTSIELNEHGFLSPLKPRRKVPADTLSQIWCLAVWTSVFVQELQQIKLQVCKELKFLRNLTQNPNQCGTSLHNGEIAMARHVNVWRWKSCLYIQRC